MKVIEVFFSTEQSSSVALLGATFLAIGLANSPFKDLYQGVLHYPLAIPFIDLDKSVHHWIDDGLMAVFFLLVGLEIRREFTVGELADKRSAMLPLMGALGGIVVPVIFYLLVNARSPEFSPGWAIGAATDIAFAVAVLGLVGNGLPRSLRAFLLALAILDDIGAIIIIAIFYTNQLDHEALLGALAILATMAFLRWKQVKNLWIFFGLGLLLWLAISYSGVHATLSGILTAFFLPGQPSKLEEIEERLLPWTAYLVIPLFALANAGLDFSGVTVDLIFSSLPLGITVALFFGKQIGVMVGASIAIAFRWGKMPARATWRQLYGVAILTGIGFTMSLFIGRLAFPSEDYQNSIRLGVIAGSLLSFLWGAAWLGIFARNPKPATADHGDNDG